jgi:hypothetical protein
VTAPPSPQRRFLRDLALLLGLPGVIMAVFGETRRTAEGVPVVWDLVLVDSNTYRWHRTDWPWGGSTKAIRRCPADAGSP